MCYAGLVKKNLYYHEDVLVDEEKIDGVLYGKEINITASFWS